MIIIHHILHGSNHSLGGTCIVHLKGRCFIRAVQTAVYVQFDTIRYDSITYHTPKNRRIASWFHRTWPKAGKINERETEKINQFINTALFSPVWSVVFIIITGVTRSVAQPFPLSCSKMTDPGQISMWKPIQDFSAASLSPEYTK